MAHRVKARAADLRKQREVNAGVAEVREDVRVDVRGPGGPQRLQEDREVGLEALLGAQVLELAAAGPRHVGHEEVAGEQQPGQRRGGRDGGVGRGQPRPVHVRQHLDVGLPGLVGAGGVGGPCGQQCSRREGTSEAAPEAVRQAVGGGCQSGWGRFLSVTNAIEVGTCRSGDSG